MTAIDWLLDSDPSIRWQVMRDLTDQPADTVAAERLRIAEEGWGARLLALQGADGQWEGGALFPARRHESDSSDPPDQDEGQPWTATEPTLTLLREFGVEPGGARVRRAVAQVRDNCRWEHAGQPFFAGEVEPCINGRAVALGAYFGQDVKPIVDRLLGEQLSDGGWNCEAERGSIRSSFHSTICVLEGLLEHELTTGASPDLTAARLRAHEYLLERRMFRRLSTGEVVDLDWTLFSFPTRWHYDVLRGLDYLRSAGVASDERCAEAVNLVKKNRHSDGRWPLQNPHPGQVHFEMEEGAGKPSRWNTLRAMRVLDWYEHGPSDGASS